MPIKVLRVMKKRTFTRGGIHPHNPKVSVKDNPVYTAALPTKAVVPFSQHIGAPAKPVVKIGDYVKEAQVIGEAAGFISAFVHAPISGTVTEMSRIYLPGGMKSDAAVIEHDGQEAVAAENATCSWEKLEIAEILEIIKQKGVVGQGGATFPSHVKFSVPKGHKCEVFLVNAAECEPYLSADHSLLLDRKDDFLEGIQIIRKLLRPEQVIIGIESNKADAISLLKPDAASLDITLIPLKVKYPQGAEKNLIEATLGREVPSGKLPLEVGVINANVSTVVSVCEAVRDQRPVIERVLTLAGAALKNPCNVRARVGVSIRDIINQCGGLYEEPAKYISGGPMMGFAFQNLDTPVTKGTSGILALNAKEVQHFSQTACLSCGECVRVCPMGLSPTTIFKNIEHERLDHAEKFGLNDCVLCGCCAYSCPAHIPLVSAFRAARGRQRRLNERKKR